MKKCDYLVIGAGSGGVAFANAVAAYGCSVVLVERGRVGGTCVNVGCVPKKLVWGVMDVFEEVGAIKELGFVLQQDGFCYANFRERREAYIQKLHRGYEAGLVKSGVDFLRGDAVFLSPNRVRVGEEGFCAGRVVVASGSEPTVPNVEGAFLGWVSDDVFHMKRVPKSVSISGSGYVALEMACVFAGLQEILYGRVGVKVLIRSRRTLRVFDEDLSKRFEEEVGGKGVELCFENEVQSLSKGNEGILVKTNQQEFLTERHLWAVGRKSCTEKLGLESAGIDCDKKGFVVVDERFATSVPNHYALGDVIDKPQLTPAAIQSARRLAAHLEGVGDEGELVDWRFVPTVVFTHPPLATVGLSEKEARETHQGEEVFVYQASFSPMRFAFAEKPPRFYVKLVCVGKTQRVVGLHMLGPGCDEILQGFAVAIRMGATKRDFDQTLAIHPTTAEEVVTLKPIWGLGN